jgi:NTE family protein
MHWSLVRAVSVAFNALAFTASMHALAASQQSAESTDTQPLAPRIGLVLSGGGARGVAHIGVLKVLEEMRIPISCVTGTSMGSIIGGTYAVGTSPHRLEELVLAADWDELFRDNPPRTELSIRRKSDDFKTLFAPEFGLKDGRLTLPKGVIAGVSLEAFFRELAQPAISVSDFRKLPIPFAAMATDLENGDSIVIDHGSVAQAMRASMSVPGAIAPVEIDGRILVDGGIANNLPIDEARKLCADVIIAVNIATPPLKRDELDSALAVTLQLVNFLGKQTVDRQLKSMGPGDVLLEPDLGSISATSFARSKDAIRAGEEATRKLASSLSRYSIAAGEYAQFRARQTARSTGLGSVDEIRIEGLQKTNPQVVRELVESKTGESLTERQIDQDLRRIYGRGDYESVSYRILGDEGPRTLVITPKEKLWGPDYLRFGIGLESDFQGDNSFNVLAQYRRTWINRLGGELLIEGQVGQDTHLYSEWYQPLHAAGTWFGSAYGVVGQTTRNVFNGDDQIADYLIGSVRGGIDLGANMGTIGTVRFGPQWTRVNARVDVGDPVLPSVRQLTAGGRVALVIDQFDTAWFPRAGYGATASYYGATTALGSALDYQKIQAAGTYVTSWGANTLNLHAAAGTDFGTGMPAYETFALGGPLRLSGFRIDQFSGREFAFGRAMYYRRILALPDILGSGIYAGASAEVGRIRDRVDSIPTPGTLYSGSLFFGAQTFAGPGYLGVGFGNNGAFSLYLLLGAP